eukprot:2391853-Rhodomonas_salina.4
MRSIPRCGDAMNGKVRGWDLKQDKNLYNPDFRTSGKIPKNGIKIPKLFRSSGGSVLVFVSYYKHFPPKSRMRAKKTSMGTASGNLTSVSVTSDPALGYQSVNLGESIDNNEQ